MNTWLHTANAANTDIYVNVPLHATSEYFANLANLVRYGLEWRKPLHLSAG